MNRLTILIIALACTSVLSLGNYNQHINTVASNADSDSLYPFFRLGFINRTT